MSLASNLTAVVKKIVESADNVNSKMGALIEHIKSIEDDDKRNAMIAIANDLGGDLSTLSGMSNDLKTVLYPQSNEVGGN